MTAPRPADPCVLYAAFQNHRATCAPCQGDLRLCPYGEHVLEAWGDSDRFYANEQEMIDATLYQEDLGDQDELKDCA